jgi:putative ABC transport system permease protein
MIHNYLKIALRTVAKHRMYSMLNIGGLALGLAASLLLFLWVQQEQTVDSFHEHKDQLFMVYERARVGGKTDKADTPQVLADALKQTIPEIEYATGFAWEHNESFRSGRQVHKMKGSRAGNDFFKMFSYPLLEGTASTALSALQTLQNGRWSYP